MNSLRPHYSHSSKEQGFALVIAIALMGFLLLLSLSLAALTQIETSTSSAVSDAAKARENARLGLFVALGKLQQAAGPDRRAITTASAVNSTSSIIAGGSQWVGVWDTTSTSSAPVWLVSGSNPNPVSVPLNPIVIISEGSVGTGNASQNQVQVQKETLSDGTGNFAWWIGDQSMKASVTASWVPDESLSAYTLESFYHPDSVKKAMARRVPMRRGIEEVLPTITPGGGTGSPDISNAINLAQLLPGDDGKEKFHDATMLSLGLLTNPVSGGFKYNLTGATSDPHGFLTPSLAAFIAAERKNEAGLPGKNYYSGTASFTSKEDTNVNGNPTETDPVLMITPQSIYKGGTSFDPTVMFPDLSKKGKGYAFFSPIISEFLLRMSFIAEAENEEEIKFYVRYDFVFETWNPYPFTMEVSRSVETSTFYRSSPTVWRASASGFNEDAVKISKYRWSADDTTLELIDKFEFDPNDVVNETSTSNPEKIWANFTIPSYIENFKASLDTKLPTKAPMVLYPGEAFATRQPHWYHRDLDGNRTLVVDRRYLDAPKWYYRQDISRSGIYILPPEEQKAAIHPEDVIEVEISGTFDLSMNEKMSIDPWTYNGVETRAAQIRINGIPFSAKVTLNAGHASNPPPRNDFLVKARLDHPSRDSYQMAVQIKLKDDIASLTKLAEEFDPRTPIVEWSEIEKYYERNVFEQGSNPAWAMLNQVDLFRHKSDYDTIAQEAYRYSTKELFDQNMMPVRIFDVPSFPAVSLDVFRSAFFVEMPAFSFGEAQKSSSANKDINAAFDRYFLTGIDGHWEPSVSSNKPATALPNPNLIFSNWENTVVAGAAELRTQLSGQDAAKRLFINGSFDINSTSVAAWAAALASPQYVDDNLKTPRKGVILHMPHQPLSDTDIEDALTDTELAAKTGNAFRDAVFKQTVRVFDDPTQADSSSTLYELAVLIVKHSTEWQKDKKRPFYSMQEFADSGVITKAIDESKINTLGSETIPKLSPLYISQAKIMGIISNFSTVRGDTFLIRAYGDVVDPQTNNVRSTALCEAIVQRSHQFVDPTDEPDKTFNSLNAQNKELGRRFHVVAFTWIDPKDR